MKDYLDALVKELPQYMVHFVRCLISPRRFISERLSEEWQSDHIKEGVSFLVLSFILAVVLVVNFPDASDPVRMPKSDADMIELASDADMIELASKGVYQLFLVLGAAFITFLCWKMVGVKSNFITFFNAISYFCGVFLILSVFIGAVSNIALLDPVVGKAWVNMEKTSEEIKPVMKEILCSSGEVPFGDTQRNLQQTGAHEKMQNALEQITLAKQQPLAIISLGIQLVLFIVIFIWLFSAWLFYGKQNGIGTGKVVAAGLMAVVLLFSANLVVTLIQVSAENMEVLRSC